MVAAMKETTLARENWERLCAACQKIFSDNSFGCHVPLACSGHEKSAHHETATSFAQAVLARCSVCLLLQSNINEQRFASSQWSFEHDYGFLALNIAVRCWSEDHTTLHPSQEVFSFRVLSIDKHTRFFELAQESLQANNTGMPAVFDLAREWLITCRTQHEVCESDHDQLWYPTRLLDLRRNPIRLIETSDHQLTSPYATMSHCWGDERFTVLNTSNYASFKEGIDDAQLAQSFRDVVHTACQLNIDFLWIDSLCIVQEGPAAEQDWQQQGSMMHMIYANAILNIGVAHASTPYQGCFASRNRSIPPPLHIHWQPSTEDTSGLFHVFPRQPVSRFLELFTNNGLFDRGWVFQERLLARRMLYFTVDQIYWECSGNGQMLACEEHPNGLLPPLFKINLKPWSFETSTSRLRGGHQSLLALWSDIVTEYSALQLTYPDHDKLLALGGIARRMAGLMKDDYVVGMFRSLLVSQLAWSVRCGRRASTWRAPSWSWLSIDGEITLDIMSKTPLSSIKHVSIQLNDPTNPFGPVTAASLQLTCRPIVAEGVLSKGVESELMIADRPVRWFPDDVAELSEETPRMFAIFTAVTMPSQESPTSRRLQLEELIAVSKKPENRKHSADSPSIHGIVVRTKDGRTFRRLGELDSLSLRWHGFLSTWEAEKEVVITID